MAIWNRVPTLTETLDRIESVDLAKLRRFASDLAANGQAAMALYGPAEAAPDLQTLRERLAA